MNSRRIDITHDENKTKAKKKYEEKDPYRAVIDNVVHIVEKGLKQIHKRNINERICETYAFILYDNWWSEQEVRHNEKMEISWRGWVGGRGQVQSSSGYVLPSLSPRNISTTPGYDRDTPIQQPLHNTTERKGSTLPGGLTYL